jgi:hypothetical protein
MTSQGTEVTSLKSGLELTPKKRSEASPKASQVAYQDVFLPSALLPSKAARQAPSRARNNVPDIPTVRAVGTLLQDPAEADSNVEVPHAELEEARVIMRKVDQEVAELEKQLEQLNGKDKKKERNNANKRIFALRNSLEVTSAQRLLRDPVAECRRRQKEAEMHKVTTMQQEQVKEVVRSSLKQALEEGQGNKSAVTWKMSLKQAFAVGLTKDDKVVAQVASIVEQEEREQARQARLTELEAEVRTIAKALVQVYVKDFALKQQEEQLTLLQKSMPHGKGKGKGKAFGRTRNGGKDFGKGGARSSHMQASWTDRKGMSKGMSKSKTQVRYKMNLCRAFQRGPCPYGATCTFAHGVDELRSQFRVTANVEEKTVTPAEKTLMVEEPAKEEEIWMNSAIRQP